MVPVFIFASLFQKCVCVCDLKTIYKLIFFFSDKLTHTHELLQEIELSRFSSNEPEIVLVRPLQRSPLLNTTTTATTTVLVLE